MFESKYSKVLTIILVIVIVAIVILLGFLAYDYINKFSSTKQASDFVEDYQGNITTSEEDNTNNSQENVALDSTNEVPITDSSTSGSTGKKKYKGYTVVGTMKIPAINLEYPIFEEITTKALETGLIALYPNGDNINQVGNTVIIGHNYRNGMFFSNLKKLSNGAKIYIKDFRGTTLTYEVYNKFEAAATDSTF